MGMMRDDCQGSELAASAVRLNAGGTVGLRPTTAPRSVAIEASAVLRDDTSSLGLDFDPSLPDADLEWGTVDGSGRARVNGMSTRVVTDADAGDTTGRFPGNVIPFPRPFKAR